MNAIQWLNSLRPALPMSSEVPCQLMSNAELRRHIEQGGVVVNSERIRIHEEIDFPVFSVVFFPKSAQRKTTIV